MDTPYIVAIDLSTMLLGISIGVYFYYRSEELFKNVQWKRSVRRQVILCISFYLLYLSFAPFYPGFGDFGSVPAFFSNYFFHAVRGLVTVPLLVLLITFIQQSVARKKRALIRKYVIVILSIFIFVTAGNFAMRLLQGHNRGNSLTWAVLFSLFLSGLISVFYITLNSASLLRKRDQFEKELQISQLNELKTRAQLEALQTRINPHFLYNTLSSIAELSVAQGGKARQMTMALADIFRYSINRNDSVMTTVAHEMEVTEKYLFIESIRFEEKLEVQMDADEKARAQPIPKFILQPLAENAIKHGMSGSGGKLYIGIRIDWQPPETCIMVHDNGTPFPDNMQVGYGIQSVIDKLNWLYPGRHTISFENRPEKKIMITLHHPDTE